MKLLKIIGSLFLLICFYSCKAPAAAQKEPAMAPGPMACNITGEIVEVIEPLARVKILSAPSCGQAVSIAINEGDIVEIKFAYSLQNTKKKYPTMATQYPGLKKGDIFTAIAEERLAPGTPGYFVIYGYTKKKKKHF